jgi:RNA polymerase sigma-70 factor (ECF subfamily)
MHVMSAYAGHTRTIDWDASYAELAPELIAYVTRLLGDPSVAADLVHDAFVRAIAHSVDLRSVDEVRPWIYRIVTNVARSALRRRRLQQRLIGGVTSHPANTDQRIRSYAEREHVQFALRSVSLDEATALILFHVQGFDRREVAQIVGAGEETVKSRLARGKAKFMAAYSRIERGARR